MYHMYDKIVIVCHVSTLTTFFCVVKCYPYISLYPFGSQLHVMGRHKSLLISEFKSECSFHKRGFSPHPLDGQMDAVMDRLMETDSHAGMSEEAGCRLARRGAREHLPVGLRSGHGFCESRSPPTPGSRPRRGSASGSAESQMLLKISSPNRIQSTFTL